jgi:hypothetical protein
MELSKEIIARAEQRPKFNVLFIGEGESRLSPFRGDSMIKEFTSFYRKHADISYMTMSPSKARTLTRDILGDTNLIYIDSSVDAELAMVISKIQQDIMEELDPGFRDKLESLLVEDKPLIEKSGVLELQIQTAQEKGEDITDLIDQVNALKLESKSESYAVELSSKRANVLRVIYALDEFIWQAPVGRACSIGTVLDVETLIEVSDTIVVPDANLADAVTHFNYVTPGKEFFVIPTAASQNFFPIMRDFSKKFGTVKMDKPTILIKGTTIPESVQDFIANYYKQFNIAVSSVGALNDHVMSLLAHKKVSHINHFANPQINVGNREIAYAVERDSSYDFVMYCEDPEIGNDFYSLTSGDEEVLFAIASGSVPICGVDHVGYDKSSLYYASGLTFNPITVTGRNLYDMIKAHSIAVKWNEAFGKSKAALESRISNSPTILAKYWQVFLGRDIAQARQAMAEKERKRIEDEVNVDAQENVDDLAASQSEKEKNSNVIAGNFGGQ